MLELLQKIICAIGLLMFVTGASSMDSASLVIPIALCLIGGLLALATYHAYKL